MNWPKEGASIHAQLNLPQDSRPPRVPAPHDKHVWAFERVSATSSPTPLGGRSLDVLNITGQYTEPVLALYNVTTAYSTRSGATNTFGLSTAMLDSNGDSTGEQLIAEWNRNVWIYEATPKSNPPAFQIYGRAGPGTGGRIPRVSGGLPLARIGGRQIV